jgi:hypothetical protein
MGMCEVARKLHTCVTVYAWRGSSARRDAPTLTNIGQALDTDTTLCALPNVGMRELDNGQCNVARY